MKNKLTLILFIACNAVVYSQLSYQDVVRLNTIGTAVQGIIVDQIPSSILMIKADKKSELVYKFGDIVKSKKTSMDDNTDFTERGPGYLGVSEFCYSLGLGNDDSFLKINGINGYRFSPYFALSIGTGVWFDLDFRHASIPLFLDFRTNFINSKVTPYCAAGFGYSFDVSNSPIEGIGFFANVTFGIGFNISHKGAINVGTDITRYLDN